MTKLAQLRVSRVCNDFLPAVHITRLRWGWLLSVPKLVAMMPVTR